MKTLKFIDEIFKQLKEPGSDENFIRIYDSNGTLRKLMRNGRVHADVGRARHKT